LSYVGGTNLRYGLYKAKGIIPEGHTRDKVNARGDGVYQVSR
jgi:hypothetical protein